MTQSIRTRKILILILLSPLILLITVSTSAFPQNDRHAGTVERINGSDIIVKYDSPETPFRAGSLLHVTAGGESLTLEIIAPMQTLAKCRLSTSDKTKIGLLRKGMIAYYGMARKKKIQGEENDIICKLNQNVSFLLKNMKVPSAGFIFPDTYSGNGKSMIDNDFLLSECEITYEIWSTVYDWSIKHGYTFENKGAYGSKGIFPDKNSLPVTTVSWRDAIVWCNAFSEYMNEINTGPAQYVCVYTYQGDILRNAKDADRCDHADQDRTVNGFRLPLSAEWLYAADYRGTDKTNAAEMNRLWWTNPNSASGAVSDIFSKPEATGSVAWYKKNSGGRTHPVKTRKANALGLFDMSGNVSEWCFDYVSGGRVLRGESYGAEIGKLPLVLSQLYQPDLAVDDAGFRIAITRDGKTASMIEESDPDNTLNDNANGTLTDRNTGLTWLKDANIGRKEMSREDAVALCGKLRAGGYSDWRLPTVKELETLTRGFPEGSDKRVLLKRRGFENVQDEYWTTDNDASPFQIIDGIYEYSKPYRFFVWPVRKASR